MSELGVQNAQRTAALGSQAGIVSQPALARVQLPAVVPMSERTVPRKQAQPHIAPRDMAMGKSPIASSPVAVAFAGAEQLKSKPERKGATATDREPVRKASAESGASFLAVHNEQNDASALKDFSTGRFQTFDSTHDFVEGITA